MTRKQVENVCRHFGLIEWVDEFSALVIDKKSVSRDFWRLVRRGRGKRCFEMMTTLLSEWYIRNLLDCYPHHVAALNEAEAIANS